MGEDEGTQAAHAAASMGRATAAGGEQIDLLMPRDDADARLARLALAIENEIIPRLMMAHRAAGTCPSVPAAGPALGAQDVEEFARLVLEADDEAAQGCIETLLARGVPLEAIYHDLLAPTARHLGDLWNRDLCDFTDVTLGLGRLQRVLRETSAHLVPPLQATGADVGRRILLLPGPGEQHTFGLVMVAEFFRRAGWEVAGGPWETADDAPGLVGGEWYDAIGFSLGHDSHIDRLAECIRGVRQSSRNGQIVVLVGGPIAGERPDLATRLGADLAATDGRQAPALAARVVARHAGGG